MRAFFFFVLVVLVCYGGYRVVRVFLGAEEGGTGTTQAAAAGTQEPAPAPLPPSTPAGGYVPDAETASAIAAAVWRPLYGLKRIEQEKPYKASLSNGVWTVVATAPDGKGGAAFARIARDDGRILLAVHGK